MILQCWKTPNEKPESPKPAHRLLHNRDVLALLADEINNQATLYNLCLVNRLFNFMFSRSLYERLHIDISPDWDARREKKGFCNVIRSWKALRRVTKKGHLKYTKSIVVASTRRHTEPDFDWEGWHTYASEIVLLLLKHTPNVVSYGSSDFNPSARLLRKLAKLPNLRNLSLSFSRRLDEVNDYRIDDMEPDTLNLACDEFSLNRDTLVAGDVAWYLTGFRNLRKLSLFEVGNVTSLTPIWGACLLQVFLRNPGLRVVRLSKALDLSVWFGISQNPWAEMFRAVCDLYESSVGHALELSEIILDTVFHPRSAPFPNVVQTAVRASEPAEDRSVLLEFPSGQPFMTPLHDDEPTFDPYEEVKILANTPYRKLDLGVRAPDVNAIELERIPDFPLVNEAIIRFYCTADRRHRVPNPVPVFRKFLARFVNATALWYAPIEPWNYATQSKRLLRKTALWLFRNLKDLKYLRLETMAWKCLRDGNKVQLLPLEPLEDQLECPELFEVPLWPKSKSGVLHHDL